MPVAEVRQGDVVKFWDRGWRTLRASDRRDSDAAVRIVDWYGVEQWIPLNQIKAVWRPAEE